jgi:hypothetical protein
VAWLDWVPVGCKAGGERESNACETEENRMNDERVGPTFFMDEDVPYFMQVFSNEDNSTSTIF